MSHDVCTGLYFLDRDSLYERERVYELDYDPGNGFPTTNMKLTKFDDLNIQDVRGRKDDLSFDAQGFAIMELDTTMSIEDFEDPNKVEEVYLKEVCEKLLRLLGASRVQVFDQLIRKRHHEYPMSTGKAYDYSQPSSIVHIDITPRYTEEMVRKLNPENANDLLKSRVQCVNIWKPLRGPVRDWPLTLCDPFTIDPDHDLLARDLVYRHSVTETYQVHRSDKQQWFYLSDQTAKEAWVFLQSDSKPHSKPGVPHTAFANPLTLDSDPCRESIEVRVLVYYNVEGTKT